MARQPNIFENYFKNSLIGRGLSYLRDQQQRQQFGFVNEDGFIDAPRPSPSTVPKSAAEATAGDRAANDPLYGRGESSMGLAGDTYTQQKITEDFYRRNPVFDPSREGYNRDAAQLELLKRRKKAAEAGSPMSRLTGGFTFIDQQRMEALEAKLAGGEEEKKDEPADKLEDISQKTFGGGTGAGTAGTGTAAGAQAEYTKAKSESVGQAEDEAIEMIKKGRRATILTKPGGLLGSGEEEGQTRARRALIGR